MLSSYNQWLEEYRKDKYKIWIKIILSNKEERYFSDYSDWYKIKKYCQDNLVNVDEIGLQYRSNYLGIDATNCDGVYLVQSIIGVMGENSKKTFTVGKIKGEMVEKQVFLTPELIEDRTENDSVTSCFEEGLLYHYDQSKAQTI
jgi:hypothetical protein